jgi:L-aminopeptidase/D-esterase-like protein
VFNGFGKMTGATQVAELGSIETPVHGLERIGMRAFGGLARCGSDFAGHDGDYALAVSGRSAGQSGC